MNVLKSVVALVVLAAVVSGCAPKVLPATTHQPSSPAAVKIYQKAPKEYEKLGVVSLQASDKYKWDENGNADAGFDELKRQAAAMGANGLLLETIPGTTNARVAAGYHSEFFSVPVNNETKPVTAHVNAIFVHKEK